MAKHESYLICSILHEREKIVRRYNASSASMLAVFQSFDGSTIEYMGDSEKLGYGLGSKLKSLIWLICASAVAPTSQSDLLAGVIVTSFFTRHLKRPLRASRKACPAFRWPCCTPPSRHPPVFPLRTRNLPPLSIIVLATRITTRVFCFFVKAFLYRPACSTISCRN